MSDIIGPDVDILYRCHIAFDLIAEQYLAICKTQPASRQCVETLMHCLYQFEHQLVLAWAILPYKDRSDIYDAITEYSRALRRDWLSVGTGYDTYIYPNVRHTDAMYNAYYASILERDLFLRMKLSQACRQFIPSKTASYT